MSFFTQTFIIFLASASISGVMAYRIKRKQMSRKDYDPDSNPNKITSHDVRIDV